MVKHVPLPVFCCSRADCLADAMVMVWQKSGEARGFCLDHMGEAARWSNAEGGKLVKMEAV